MNGQFNSNVIASAFDMQRVEIINNWRRYEPQGEKRGVCIHCKQEMQIYSYLDNEEGKEVQIVYRTCSHEGGSHIR